MELELEMEWDINVYYILCDFLFSFRSFVRIWALLRPQKIAILWTWTFVGGFGNDDLFATHVKDFHLPHPLHSMGGLFSPSIISVCPTHSLKINPSC